jgi:hypothetical protein
MDDPFVLWNDNKSRARVGNSSRATHMNPSCAIINFRRCISPSADKKLFIYLWRLKTFYCFSFRWATDFLRGKRAFVLPCSSFACVFCFDFSVECWEIPERCGCGRLLWILKIVRGNVVKFDLIDCGRMRGIDVVVCYLELLNFCWWFLTRFSIVSKWLKLSTLWDNLISNLS